MIAIITAALTSAWAWVLPWAAPILARAGFWAAGARAVTPKGIGGTLLALGAGAILALVLWHKLDAWWDPPPPTFTAAQIEAARYKTENAELRKSLDERLTEINRRDKSIERLATRNEEITTEMEAARAKSAARDAVVVPADDHWLLEWHRRGW